MNNEIIDLSDEEIIAIAGGGQIDPPAITQSTVYPEVENDPPLPPG